MRAIVPLLAFLGLQGCGGGGGGHKSGTVCTSNFTLPSYDSHPTAEKVELQFSEKECCADLHQVVDPPDVMKDLFELAGALYQQQKDPDVPKALVEAAKPLCDAGCNYKIHQCKTAKGEICEATQLVMYKAPLVWTCMSEPVEAGSVAETEARAAAELGWSGTEGRTSSPEGWSGTGSDVLA